MLIKIEHKINITSLNKLLKKLTINIIIHFVHNYNCIHYTYKIFCLTGIMHSLTQMGVDVYKRQVKYSTIITVLGG